jgi:hypothetical protein
MVVKDNGEEYEAIPTGPQQAICLGDFDLGYQQNTFGIKHEVVLLWELETRKQNGERFTVTKRYTASLAEKANLRHDLESWRGRAFTAKELEGFELGNLKGINCTLNLVETTGKNGKNYVNIASIMNLTKGLEKIKRETPEDFIPKWVETAIQKQIPAPSKTTKPETETASDHFDDDIPF